MKFLIILIGLFIFLLLGLNYAKKYIRKKIDNAFGVFNNQPPETNSEQYGSEVLYEKNDIVVLKGEATNNKDEK